ncbi:hypothetical protein BKA80DRAFT_286474, partial [Phyllosticta citrichinensis]
MRCAQPRTVPSPRSHSLIAVYHQQPCLHAPPARPHPLSSCAATSITHARTC